MSHLLDTTSANKRNPKVAPEMHQKKTETRVSRGAKS
jgi:hypothetical protein